MATSPDVPTPYSDRRALDAEAETHQEQQPAGPTYGLTDLECQPDPDPDSDTDTDTDRVINADPHGVSDPDGVADSDRVIDPDGVTDTDRVAQPDGVAECDRVG